MARSCLEDFVIGDELGTGSFGTVYKAVRKADGQQYALKEVDLQTMSALEQEDCIKECSVLASLDSPYIIKFYDSFLQKGKLYICMEYAQGGNLYDHIRRQTAELPEERVWQLFIQMLLGLNYMHDRKIMHRDFKTMNVFLDDKLNVRLGDLGVAKVLSDETVHARTMIGTPYYLSPEMCEDKPYNEKSDVWALGVGVYECCARRHPFDAENQGGLILKILRGKYPAITGYSKELTNIVKSCLTLDASKRPGTTSLLALKSVREHAKELDIELPPLPPGKPASPSPPPSTQPSRPSITAAKSFKSRRSREPDTATEQPSSSTAAAVPSRSPKPPVTRTPSARAPVAVAKVDIAAGLSGLPSRSPTPPLGRSPSARTPAAMARVDIGAAALAAAGQAGRRASSDAVPGGLPGAQQGSVEQQLAGLKLQPGAAHSRRHSADRISASVSPEPEATAAPEHHTYAAAGQAPSSSSSHDSTPLVEDRAQGLQKTLQTVRMKLAGMVGPLACDALHSTVIAMAQSGNSSSPTEQQESSLLAAVQRVVPHSAAPAVLPLLVKMMYLESQVDEAAPAADPVLASWDCGL